MSSPSRAVERCTRWTLRRAARLLGSAAGRLDALAATGSVHGSKASAHDRAVARSAAAHDMAALPDELYYARHYLHWIRAALDASEVAGRDLLDLGCGQGRLSLPLAEWCAERGGELVGVDFTRAAVEQANAYARVRGVQNATFERADLLDFARALPDLSVDAVLLIEVTFFLPAYREALQEIARVLRPGGLAFVAFRSQYFNLLHALHHRRFESAEMALAQREGYLFDKGVWFTWQDRDDVARLIEDAGMRLLHVRGIGVCSGIEGDPLAAIVRPSQLSAEEQERLLAVELAAAEPYAASGRYMLATAEKPKSAS